MGKQSAAEIRFRQRLQEERGRRNWSRADLAKMLQRRGFEHIYSSTVAKIEYGERSVRIDEATAIADLFEVPLDVLIGRTTGPEIDLEQRLRTVRETTALFGYQIQGLLHGLDDRWDDLYKGADFEGREALHADFRKATTALIEARDALGRLTSWRPKRESLTRETGSNDEAQS